jgi:hypothetical protein
MKQFMYDDRHYPPVPDVEGLGVGGHPPNLVDQRGHDGHTKTSVRQDDGDDGGPDFGHDSFLENLRKM